MSLPETLRAELELLVAREQSEKRLPSIAAAVVRDGEVVWETAVGDGATAGAQYRLGSITKTFTAAAIMQLRDAGKLDLEDRLDVHVEGAAHAPTLRRLLSHTSGLQRETHDDAWLNQRFADVDELLSTLDRAERVLPPGQRFHYSNLAFALLGVVVERVSGLPYRDYVEQRLLQPVGLTRTSFDPDSTAAAGFLVKPFEEGVWDEAPIETGAWIAAGQMWGTVADLCRWAAFLAEP
ncbi:MAG: serine hydrolase domain-containing protein, partial [Actinomycetota bacterium]